MNSPERAPYLEFAAMAVVTGVVASLYGYFFGNVEQTPLIMRHMDPSFLTSDFAVNAFDTYGPRYYYAKMMAVLARATTLPAAYLAVLIVASTAVAFVTCLAGWTLFDGSRFAGLLSCAVVMSVNTFGLGYKPDIVFPALIPSGIAIPLVLTSVFAGLRFRPLLSAAAAALATPVHPLFGLETGVIMLGVQLVAGWRRRRHRPLPLVPLAGAAAIVVAAALIWAWPYRSAGHIPVDRLFEIISFRAPHHYLPSNFHVFDYLSAACFIAAGGIAWWQWRRANVAAEASAGAVVVLTGVLLLLCAGGYFFVEVVPTRLWLVAQTYRLLFLIKWLGLVLMAGVAAQALTSRAHADRNEHAMLPAMLSPPSAAVTKAGIVIGARLRTRPEIVGPAVLVVFAIVLLLDVSQRSVLLYAFFALLAWFARGVSRRVFVAVLFVVALGYAGVAYVAHGVDLSARSSGFVAELDPAYSVDDRAGDYADAARFVRDNTPRDAILLTPPRGGWMRVVGERAIVIDFACFPFDEPSMLEWRRRIQDCYGTTERAGWPAANDLDRNYRSTPMSRIRDLQSSYGITHAVFYLDTPVDLPVLYRNGTYKVVSVSG